MRDKKHTRSVWYTSSKYEYFKLPTKCSTRVRQSTITSILYAHLEFASQHCIIGISHVRLREIFNTYTHDLTQLNIVALVVAIRIMRCFLQWNIFSMTVDELAVLFQLFKSLAAQEARRLGHEALEPLALRRPGSGCA